MTIGWRVKFYITSCTLSSYYLVILNFRHHEAVSHFEALLVDLIRQPDYTWKEAKKVLKKDTR